MSLLETCHIQCPYCWEVIEVVVDCSVEQQRYIEDCSVCCQPMVLDVAIDAADIPQVIASREDE